MTRRPKLLDLFCGAGGSAAGYARLGFDVTGVDVEPMPRYLLSGAGRFVQGDAFDYLAAHGHEYDAIHASPPCQRYSTMTRRWGRESDHPDLIGRLRFMLDALGTPYAIENVPGAPMRRDALLCGSMLGLGAVVGGEFWQLRRHRWIESNVPIFAPGPCRHEGRTVGVYGHPGGSSKRDGIRFAQVAEWCAAMGIHWMELAELTEAVPPAYAEWVGVQLRVVLALDSAA